MALAKGLALAHNLPLIGIPTLDILVHGQSHRPEPMLAVIRAGRERMLGLWYKWGHKGWQSIDEMVNFTWSEIREILTERTYICGELNTKGRQTLSEEQHAVLAAPAHCVRRPSVLAELAWQKLRSGKISDPSLVAPVYFTTQS
jgi:tRNA threonylcarbamoyladenosine biosynthesis protein TsaB